MNIRHILNGMTNSKEEFFNNVIAIISTKDGEKYFVYEEDGDMISCIRFTNWGVWQNCHANKKSDYFQQQKYIILEQNLNTILSDSELSLDLFGKLSWD